LSDSNAPKAPLDDFLRVHAPIVYLRVDAEGSITETNAYTRKVLGKDVVGEPIESIFVDFGHSPSPRASALTVEDQLMNIVTFSGAPESLRCRFLPDGDGLLVLGSLDPEEQEHLRTQLLGLNQELSAKTRALHKANAQLAQLNAVKNEFLGMVSHDLRKPVGLVLNYSEFLIDEVAPKLNEEYQGFLDTIRAGAEYMHRVIDDYLDVAMIEAGRFDISPAQGQLSEVVQRAIDLTNVSARKHQVSVDYRAEAHGPLSFDAAKMEQVVINLLANAIEHSPAGETVHVSLVCDDAAAQVRVEDRAGGIPEKEIHGLFEAYARASTNKAGKVRSIGLGLAIARKIAEAHGGRIQVESEHGVGSVFTVSIPLPTATAVR
jgi:signal transduction histidine kinase